MKLDLSLPTIKELFFEQIRDLTKKRNLKVDQLE